VDVEQVSALFQETIRTSLWLAAPILATALLTGLAISILQAATQVNEQTLSFVPKIVLTLVVFAVSFSWFMTTLVDFGHRLLTEVASRGGP
jgi:flagellar biosynthetic protein FliQ